MDLFKIFLALAGLALICSTGALADSSTPETPASDGAEVDPASEDHWFLPGQVMRAEPNGEAKRVAKLMSAAILPVLERRGSWVKVRYLGKDGWLDGQWAPTWNRADAYRSVQRNIVERAVSSNQKRLKVAKKLLGLRRPTRSTKDLDIYTDVDDGKLLDRIERASELGSEIFFAHFGRLPSGKPKETVVLFQSRDDYEAYLDKVLGGRHSGTGGHAGWGLAVMWRGEKSESAVLDTLLHEIAHLLVGRSLSARLPPWLNEGLASHAGSVWIEGEMFRGKPVRFRDIDFRVGIMGVQMKKGTMPGIGALAALDREGFSEHAGTAYQHAAAFIYFLQQDPGYNLGFAAFLDDIAAGYQGQMGLLLKHLDTDIETLDREFRWWLKRQNEVLNERKKDERSTPAGQSSIQISPSSRILSSASRR